MKFMFRELFPRMDIQLSPEIAIRLYYYIILGVLGLAYTAPSVKRARKEGGICARKLWQERAGRGRFIMLNTGEKKICLFYDNSDACGTF